jgi:predicted ATPase
LKPHTNLDHRQHAVSQLLVQHVTKALVGDGVGMITAHISFSHVIQHELADGELHIIRHVLGDE